MDGKGLRIVEEGLAEGFGSRGRVGPVGVRVADPSGSRRLSFTGVVPKRSKMAEGLFMMAECSFEIAGGSFVKLGEGSFKMADGSFKMANGFFMMAGVSFKVAEVSFKVAVGFPIEFRRPVEFFISYSSNIFSNPIQKVSKVFSFFARNQFSAKCQRNRVALNSF
jgi:hypothetical protein